MSMSLIPWLLESVSLRAATVRPGRRSAQYGRKRIHMDPLATAVLGMPTRKSCSGLGKHAQQVEDAELHAGAEGLPRRTQQGLEPLAGFSH